MVDLLCINVLKLVIFVIVIVVLIVSVCCFFAFVVSRVRRRFVDFSRRVAFFCVVYVLFVECFFFIDKFCEV